MPGTDVPGGVAAATQQVAAAVAQRVALERRAARRGRGRGWGRPAEATRTGQDPEPPSHVRAPLTGFSRQERGGARPCQDVVCRMEKRSQGGKRTRAGVSRAMSWGPRLELARGPGAARGAGAAQTLGERRTEPRGAARVPGGRLASPASGRHLGRPLGKRARPGGARSRALCAWPPLSARCHHAAVSPVEGSARPPLLHRATQQIIPRSIQQMFRALIFVER